MGTVRNNNFYVVILEQCCNFSKQCHNDIATLGPCCSNNGLCESSRVILTARCCELLVQKSCSDVMMASFIIKEETRTIRHLECTFDAVSYLGLTLFTLLATHRKMALYWTS